MVPRILHVHPKTYKRLIRLRKQAERDGAYRVAKRLQAVVLNSEGRTSGELANLLKAPRSRVSEWLARYQAYGLEGLLEGHRSGRPWELTPAQRKQLDNILDSGPVAYGLDTVSQCPGGMDYPCAQHNYDGRQTRRQLRSIIVRRNPGWQRSSPLFVEPTEESR